MRHFSGNGTILKTSLVFLTALYSALSYFFNKSQFNYSLAAKWGEGTFSGKNRQPTLICLTDMQTSNTSIGGTLSWGGGTFSTGDNR